MLNNELYYKKSVAEVVEHRKETKESLKIGDIVYYPHLKDSRYEVLFGEVVDFYSDCIALQNYDSYDSRLINGIPANEFVTPTDWKKLPKGWSYDTKLFDLTFDVNKFGKEKYNLKSKDDIRHLIDIGAFVKPREKDYCDFESEFNHNGYRIVRRYDTKKEKPDIVTVTYENVYNTCDEVVEVIKEYERELLRQANLSDEEWNIEQIDKTLDMWGCIYQIDKDVKDTYRDFILKLDNIADVAVRIYNGDIQWKYGNKVRWNNIELN